MREGIQADLQVLIYQAVSSHSWSDEDRRRFARSKSMELVFMQDRRHTFRRQINSGHGRRQQDK